MAWDGVGNFNRLYNWVADAAADIDIDATRMDAEFDGIVTGLENCVTRDGQNTPSANLPMGNRKHTGVANATALTDYATADQVVKNSLCYGGASAAGTDTYAVNLPISPGSYAAGRRYSFIADVANTGACTINFNSIGAASIKLQDGSDPYTNAIIPDQIVEVEYDGTNMVLLNPQKSEVYADITTTTVSNTTTETTIFTRTIPANALAAGDTVRLTVFGLLTNNTGSPQGADIRSTFGGSSIGSIVFPKNVNTGTTARLVKFVSEVVVTGASTQIGSDIALITEPAATSTIIDNGPFATDAHIRSAHNFSLAIDTTATITHAVLFKFDAASASLTFVMHSGVLEVIKPTGTA